MNYVFNTAPLRKAAEDFLEKENGYGLNVDELVESTILCFINEYELPVSLGRKYVICNNAYAKIKNTFLVTNFHSLAVMYSMLYLGLTDMLAMSNRQADSLNMLDITFYKHFIKFDFEEV